MRLRFFIIGLLLSLVVTLIAAPLVAPLDFDRRNREEDMTASFESTCVVESKEFGGMGAGTMLDTGYILTAAHVIDLDQNGVLRASQRIRTVTFSGVKYKASLAYIDTENDFAFLKPEEEIPVRGATVSMSRHALGDKVYAIGATGGHPLNISPGLILSPGFSGNPRASCYVSRGNSGGGIFDSKKEVLGLVSMVGITRRANPVSLMVPVPDGDNGYSLIWVRGTVNIMFEVNNNCLFVSTSKIRKELSKRSVTSLLDKPQSPPLLNRLGSPLWRGIIATVVNIGILLWVVIYVRKYLVGSRLS